MKKIILLSIFLFIGITKYYGQSWQWKDATLDSKILKDSDDNLYVFSNGSANFTIRKLDVNGITLWTKTGTGNAVITAYKIDNLNNLIIVGNLTSSTAIDAFTLMPNGTQSFFILKISPASSVLSANVYGSPGTTFANDLFINAAGDYLIGGGFTGSFDVHGTSVTGDTLLNCFIIKTDSNQNLLWSEKSTLYTFSGEAFFNEIVETVSGKIYATITMSGGLVDFKGYQFTSSGQFIIQLNNLRNITWSDYLDYPGVSHNSASDLQTNADTAYMKENSISGSSYVSSVSRWNDTGMKTTRHASDDISVYVDDLGYTVANGKIYYAFIGNKFGGGTYRKIGSMTLGLSDVGETSDSIAYLSAIFSEVQYIDPSSLYIGGFEGSFFAAKYDMSLATSVLSKDESDQFQVFPNPAQNQFTLQLNESHQKNIQQGAMICIYDQLGNCILRQQFSNSSTQQVDVSKIAKGIYFVEVETGKDRINRKLVLD